MCVCVGELSPLPVFQGPISACLPLQGSRATAAGQPGPQNPVIDQRRRHQESNLGSASWTAKVTRSPGSAEQLTSTICRPLH